MNWIEAFFSVNFILFPFFRWVKSVLLKHVNLSGIQSFKCVNWRNKIFGEDNFLTLLYTRGREGQYKALVYIFNCVWASQVVTKMPKNSPCNKGLIGLNDMIFLRQLQSCNSYNDYCDMDEMLEVQKMEQHHYRYRRGSSSEDDGNRTLHALTVSKTLDRIFHESRYDAKFRNVNNNVVFM